MKWILSAQSAQEEFLQMGGKAKNLHLLSNHGLPVPKWFCVSLSAFDSFASTLRPAIAGILSDLTDPVKEESLEKASNSIRELLMNQPLPVGLEEELNQAIETLDSPLFAVRSSAAAEDSAQNSFAGQLDSYLFVKRDQIVERLKDCWASAFNPRLVRYLREKGISDNWSRTGVVIQSMVLSRVSGVMFLANPTGRLTDLVIVAGYGLGEGIVSDRVETDQYILDTLTGNISSQIREKKNKIILDADKGSGTILAEVMEADRAKPALSNQHILFLSDLGRTISDLFDHVQDIEWALDDRDRFFITQSRPITTIPRGSRSLFDNSNIVESYPGITLPLTFSYIKQGYEVIFRNACIRLGISRRVVFHNHTLFKNLLGYIDGRVYYYLSNWHQMMLQLPGMEKMLPVWENSLGIKRKTNLTQKRTAGYWLKKSPRMLIIFWRLLRDCLSLNRQMKIFKKRLLKVYIPFRKNPLSALDNQALCKLYNDSASDLFYGWEITLVNDLLAAFFSHFTKASLSKRNVENADNLFNELMCGDKGMESVEPVRSLVSLGQMLRGDPKLCQCLQALLQKPQPDGKVIVAELRSKPEYALFCAQFDRHLQLYGDRGLEELKLETQSNRERPEVLLRLLTQYAASDISVEAMEQKEQAIRREASRKVRGLYRFRPMANLWFRLCLRLARRSIRHRESSRLDRARAYDIPRQIFRQIGANLAQEGALSQPRDIFFLNVEEIQSFIFGNSPDGSLARLVDQRKEQHAQNQKKNPEDRIVLQGTVGVNFIPQKRTNWDPTPGDTRLQGTPCSPGLVTAQALVVREPSAAQEIKGKILVAEMTDPGWVFLMVSAAGLIVEKGSLLSHTAIIGRELGIPTIVAVEGATSRIPSGAWVEMNAHVGEIQILPTKRVEP